jgi:N-acetylmuramoyl-L-alanine amidase/putative methionine-R-sulfoxide reductase with GAF domain
MATATTNPSLEGKTPSAGVVVPLRPLGQTPSSFSTDSTPESQRNKLQALLALLALHEQVRRRKTPETRRTGDEAAAPEGDFEAGDQFTLDEVLQLVADRAVAITGADGLAIALAENNELVLRSAAGAVRPDLGARIDRDATFSGACFRTAKSVSCDDTETDARVNRQACRRLGARSMVAVPLCGRGRAIGVLQAFSALPSGFNDSDVRNLSLLAELLLGALTPEDEDRLAESAQVAATTLEAASPNPETVTAAIVPAQFDQVELAQALIIARKLLEEVTSTEDETTRALNAAILHGPALEPEESSSGFQPTVATEPTTKLEGDLFADPAVDPARVTATSLEAAPSGPEAAPVAEPEMPAKEPDRLPRLPGMLVLLVCTAIASALAGGVWWKLKPSQLANKTVRAENTAPKPMGTPVRDAPAASSGTAANPTHINPGTTSNGSRATNAPAKPRELSNLPMVTGIQHWSSADSSTVILNLEDQVQCEAHRLADPDRIYFDLHDTQLASNLAWKSIDVGDALLKRIRAAQPVTGMTRIVLETNTNTDFSVSLEPNPYRLVVEVHKVGARHKGAVNRLPNAAETEKNKLPIMVPPPGQEDLQLRRRVAKLRIVVDAGHGGRDRGTVGRDGLLEKDLVLEIGQRLGKLLEGRLGMDVIYTRQDDSYIPLDERASIANQAQADLFVSVHANYSDLPSARGVETYYTNFFMVPASKDVDMRSGAGGARNAATAALSPADLQERVEQSRRLADSVQRSLYGTLSSQNPGLRDRGIKEANFVVLTESAMPGILAEVSFVSSPTDEQKLRSDGYREQVAEALYKGIARYAASSHGIKVASARQ